MSSAKLYAQSAEIVRDFLTGKGSLKNLCYASHITNTKATLALVYQTLKFRPVLMKILCMAQVPGYRAHDIVKYEKLERIKAAEATKEKKPKVVAPLAGTDDDEDGDFVLAKGDTLGIASAWHTCQVNVNLPIAYAREFDRDVDPRDKRHKSRPKSLKIRYMREAMLVLAYDAVFGMGLPRFASSSTQSLTGTERQVGVLTAARLLSTRPAITYIANADMALLVDYIVNNRAAEYEEKDRAYKAARLAAKGDAAPDSEEAAKETPEGEAGVEAEAEAEDNVSDNDDEETQKLTPEEKEARRIANLRAIDLDDTSRVMKQIHIANARAQKVKGLRAKRVGKMKAKALRRNGGDVSALPAFMQKEEEEEREKKASTNYPFKCLPFVPSKDWSMLQRMKSALVCLKNEAGIVTATSARLAGDSIDTENQASREEENELLIPSSLRDLTTRKVPRYVRVNSLKTTVSAAQKVLIKEGYTLLPSPPKEFLIPETAIENETSKYVAPENTRGPFVQTPEAETKVEKTVVMSDKEDDSTPTSGLVFWADPYVPFLFGFLPSDLNIVTHKMVTESFELIIQDKSSCLPPVALAPVPGAGDAIDACSAPGNKTSFLSALMQNTGTLFAVELNARRAARLTTKLQNVGATNARVLNTSFLELNPKDPRFANVKYILLDPSCSGSGNPSLDALLANEGRTHTGDSEHVRSLSDLQVSLVSHAFKFPAVEKVIYSTCSVFARENEGVVARLLPSGKTHGFAPFPVLQKWPTRGWASFPVEELEGVRETVDYTTPENASRIAPVSIVRQKTKSATPAAKKAKKAKDVKKAAVEEPKEPELRVNFPIFARVARVYPDVHLTGGFFVSGFKRSVSVPATEQNKIEKKVEKNVEKKIEKKSFPVVVSASVPVSVSVPVPAVTTTSIKVKSAKRKAEQMEDVTEVSEPVVAPVVAVQKKSASTKSATKSTSAPVVVKKSSSLKVNQKSSSKK